MHGFLILNAKSRKVLAIRQPAFVSKKENLLKDNFYLKRLLYLIAGANQEKNFIRMQ